MLDPIEMWRIAAICHEVNRVYCASIGDMSQPHWRLASDDIKLSAYKGVEWRLLNPDAPASAQHEQWCEHKLSQGWAWGLEKSADLKTHPCLIEYEDLPKEQQTKDALFMAVVDAAR